MVKHNTDNILKSFIGDIEIKSIEPYGNGHINLTFLAKTTAGIFILQKINSKIFNIDRLENNYQILKQTFDSTSGIIPNYLQSNDRIHIKDNLGEYWRCSEFLPDSRIYSISPSTEVTQNAGAAISGFLMHVNKLHPESFDDTISEFHNPSKRYKDYINSFHNSSNELKSSAHIEICFVDKHKYIIDEITDLLNNNMLPIRITHSDPKLENILFFDGKVPVVTDLDTVMKGYIMFDFGDMVRSITSLSHEDETDPGKVRFSKPHFEALCSGFFSQLSKIVSKMEMENMYNGIVSIIYVQTIRFLADYLQGNKYYRVAYKEHNLIRCRTQIKLLDEILKNEEWVRLTIEKYAKI